VALTREEVEIAVARAKSVGSNEAMEEAAEVEREFEKQEGSKKKSGNSGGEKEKKP